MSTIELIRDEFGNQTWCSDGERWLVIVQHDEDRPTHVFAVGSEELARQMVGKGYRFRTRAAGLWPEWFSGAVKDAA